MDKLSYASDSSTSAWNTYLQQIERVAPYLGELSHWVELPAPPKTRADCRYPGADG